jgi:putative transposase
MRAYHVWFSTKGRQPALEEEIGAFVADSMRQIATRTGIKLIEIEVAVDHVHVLLELDESRSLASAMHQLKGASAREVFQRFPELRFDMRSNSFWQKGYGARYVPPKEIVTVRRYIRTQLDRPLRHE